MSVIIDEKMLDHLGVLSKLELKEEERKKTCEDISDMLKYIDKLNELDTEGVDPLVQIIPMENVFRRDKISNKNEKDKMLANAPQKKDGQYVVPRTI